VPWPSKMKASLILLRMLALASIADRSILSALWLKSRIASEVAARLSNVERYLNSSAPAPPVQHVHVVAAGEPVVAGLAVEKIRAGPPARMLAPAFAIDRVGAGAAGGILDIGHMVDDRCRGVLRRTLVEADGHALRLSRIVDRVAALLPSMLFGEAADQPVVAAAALMGRRPRRRRAGWHCCRR